MSENILHRITVATRADIEERKARVPLDEMRARATAAPPPRPFADALRPAPGGPARLIAEVKRASPSKGVIAADFDPVRQARAYEAGGAAAVSVLTEPHFFQGELEHLEAVRRAVSLPVLRKDFIVDRYQVYEARAAGADAVLLICALLDDRALADLLALTRSLGMEALVEAHDAAEVRRAVEAGGGVIGVNSRDLRTFAVDHDIVRHLRPLVPGDRVFVAESGISDALGAARARAWNADAILIGEALMRAPDPKAQTHALATAPGGATAALFAEAEQPFIKLCGLTTPEQAVLAGELGAQAFGLVFANSRRRVTPEQATRIAAASRGAGHPKAVGVFVNEKVASIATIARSVGLDAVQLSGDETPEDCEAAGTLTGLPIIKALRLYTEADLDALEAFALAGATILLDTPALDGAYGGTGTTGNWNLAHEAARRWPIILSGGLTPENVTNAIRSVQARGVDVSSGIETGGVKDAEKMRAFVRAAREAQREEVRA